MLEGEKCYGKTRAGSEAGMGRLSSKWGGHTRSHEEAMTQQVRRLVMI